MRFLVYVSYDGSKYYGFQRLNKEKSVQAELERALTKINKDKVEIKGSGRTDRGVHAFNQAFHVDMKININEIGLKKALNSLLNDDIYVNKVKVVNNNFHARFDVKEKIYRYCINVGEYSAIENDYLYNYNKKLNVNKMRKACKYLKGMHSFEVFTSGERDSYNSIIYNIRISVKSNRIYITFKGKSFYRYMVRNMVGALIMVGEEKIKPIAIKEMIDANSKLYNYITAPANGLYLVDVIY